MSGNLENIATTITEAEAKSTALPMSEYAALFGESGIPFAEDDVYLIAGNVWPEYPWCLCISVIRTQVTDLISAVAPVLKAYNVGFRLAKNLTVVQQLLSGKRGTKYLNRILVVYPVDAEQATLLARALIEATVQYCGPAVPDTFQLGGLVFAQNVNRDPSAAATWPFAWTERVPAQREIRTLRQKFRIVRCVKENIKGNVYESMYLKGSFRVGKCLIKQGKQYMWMDQAGRDIGARLNWQQQVQTDIKNVVNVPQVIDCFIEDGNTYLVMEYIEGPSVQQFIEHTYQGSGWMDLSIDKQRTMLSYLMRIVDIVDKLHNHGYVHRDLTPSNFLIDKKDRLVLIDLELAYNVRKRYPLPPFTIGTKGFTSPQQQAAMEPSFTEDIYGIGGLMVAFLTGLPPVKFDRNNIFQLTKDINFFCADREIATLIAQCFHADPDQRPSLTNIKSALKQYNVELGSATGHRVDYMFDIPPASRIRQLISKTFRGTEFPELPNAELVDVFNRHYPQGMRFSFIGYLLTLRTARENKVNSHYRLSAFTQYRRYIETCFLNDGRFSSGLVEGDAGKALGTVWAMDLGILPSTIRQLKFIKSWLEGQPEGLSMMNGLAGKGIALLLCADKLDTNFVNAQLKSIAEVMVKAQHSDGSWSLNVQHGKHLVKATGLARGVAGIIYFLLECYRRYKQEVVLQSAIKGLYWLQKQATKVDVSLTWCDTEKRGKPNYSLLHGSAGIVLTFLKAYETLRMQEYKVIAERGLAGLPIRPVWNDYSLGTGLAGLGIVYSFAARILRNQAWLTGAVWISSVLVHSYQPGPDRTGKWNVDGIENYSSDFLSGNSGIVLFLLILNRELDFRIKY